MKIIGATKARCTFQEPKLGFTFILNKKTNTISCHHPIARTEAEQAAAFACGEWNDGDIIVKSGEWRVNLSITRQNSKNQIKTARLCQCQECKRIKESEK